MTDIDQLLAQIGELPLDPRLAGIDGAVFAGLADAKKPALPNVAFGAITALAMVAGILVSTLPSAPRNTAGYQDNLYPLGIPGALAPSTLLEGGR